MTDSITLPYKSFQLTVPYCLQRGSEDSVLFIHGLGGCMECFRDVWGFPGYNKYSILTYDLPGFGDSDKPREYSYSMQDQANISKLLISELNINRIHIVGHSMGGAVGLLLAQQIKPIVRSFICLEGNLIGEDCSGSRKAVSYSLDEFLKEGFEELKSEVSKREDVPHIQNASLELFLSCLSRSDPYAFYRSAKSLVKWSDSGKLLKLFIGLNIPKYYVFGEQNEDSPVMKLLLNTPKLRIPNAGHAMMTDNLSRFYQDLLTVL